MMLEWLAEGAAHRNPGLVVRGLDDFRVFKGVILKDRQPVTVDVRVGKAVRNAAPFVVPVELRGTLAERARGHAHRVPTSFWPIATRSPCAVGLSDEALLPYPKARTQSISPCCFMARRCEAIEQSKAVERASRSPAGSRPRLILRSGSTARCGATWLIDPLAIDGAFQLVGLWSAKLLGFNSLPTALGTLPSVPP